MITSSGADAYLPAQEAGARIPGSIRFAAFDLDGTLLDDDGVVVPGVPEALGHLRDLGLTLVLVTGRSATSLRYADLPAGVLDRFDPCVLVDDGDSRCDGNSGEVTAVATLPAVAVAQIAKVAEHRVAGAAGRLVASTRRAATAFAMAYRLPRDAVEIGELDGPASRMTVFDLAPVHLDGVTTATITPFQATVYTPADGGKAAGVARLLAERHGGSDLSAAIAFGDGDGDAGLLAACHIGVAAPVSSPAALAAASHHVRDSLPEFILRIGVTGTDVA